MDVASSFLFATHSHIVIRVLAFGILVLWLVIVMPRV